MTPQLLNISEIAAAENVPLEDNEGLRSLINEKDLQIGNLRKMLQVAVDGSPESVRILIRMYNEELRKTTQLLSDNEYLRKDSRIDELTGVYNQKCFLEFRKCPEQDCYGIFTDLDGFKAVNDTFGHSVGDLILQKYTEILKSNIRSSDSIYRNGGDEFFIVFRGIKDPNDAISARNKLESVLHNGFSVGTNNGIAHVSASVSKQTRPLQDKTDFDLLDLEMYHDKESRKNKVS